MFILASGSLAPPAHAGFITLPPQSATPSSTAAQPPISMAVAPAQPPMAVALASYQPLPAGMVHRLKATGQQHLDYNSRRSPHVLHRAALALRQVAYTERSIKTDSATSINRFNYGSVKFRTVRYRNSTSGTVSARLYKLAAPALFAPYLIEQHLRDAYSTQCLRERCRPTHWATPTLRASYHNLCAPP